MISLNETACWAAAMAKWVIETREIFRQKNMSWKSNCNLKLDRGEMSLKSVEAQ
jgi:hypothetical protein